MIVIATDAPLDARDLERLAARAIYAMARTGSTYSNGSGDFAIAFTTHPSLRVTPSPGPQPRTVLPTDSATGRALYVPSQIPVGGDSSGTDYDASAKFSRFNLGIDSVTDDGHKLGAFFEMDFFGNALGNQNSTNTYGVTLRHAWDAVLDVPAAAAR